MSETLDMTDVKIYEPVPTDVYTLRIIEQEEKLSKAGNPMSEFTLEIVDGNYAGQQCCRFWVTRTAKALPMVKKFLAAIGEENEGPTVEYKTDPGDNYVGYEFKALVLLATYTDPNSGAQKKSNQVEEIYVK